MSEVISANKEAVVKSCLASWTSHPLLPALPCFSISLYILLFLSLASLPHWSVIFFFPPHATFLTFPSFWPCSDSLHPWWGTIMQVYTHECWSKNFALYFRHVRGYCKAGTDNIFIKTCVFICGLALCFHSSGEENPLKKVTYLRVE